MKRVFILFVILVLALPNIVYAKGDIVTNVPKEISDVAIKGLEFVKGKISSNPEEWGYLNKEDVDRSTLGDGYRLYYLDINKLTSKSNKDDSEKISGKIDFDKIEVWQFTMDLDNKPKIFITIAFEEGEYKVVSFGGNAEHYGRTKEIFNEYMLEKNINDKPVLVQYQNTIYFTSVTNKGEFMIQVPKNYELDVFEVKSAEKIINEIMKNQKQIQMNPEGRAGSNGLLGNSTTSKINSILMLGITGTILFVLYKYCKVYFNN